MRDEILAVTDSSKSLIAWASGNVSRAALGVEVSVSIVSAFGWRERCEFKLFVEDGHDMDRS